MTSSRAVGGTGLALPLNLGLTIGGYADVARRAEALGYTRVWAAEAGNADAFGTLTAVAAATDRVGLATGVLPIYTRTPSLMAASAATLQDFSGGRFTLGVGVSSPTIVSRWNGVPYDAPLARLREYVGVVRRLLSGEKLDHPGPHYPVSGYRLLMQVPEPPPPVIIGALNERMLALGGEVADGVCLNWIGSHAVPDALAVVRSSGGDPANAVFVRVCVTDDLEAARAWGRREVMGYVIVPAYRRAFARQGWSDACELATKLWDSGDRKAAAASLPDEFIDSLCLAGSAADVRERFEQFRAAGADEPVAFPFSGATGYPAILAELEATLAALAPGPPGEGAG